MPVFEEKRAFSAGLSSNKPLSEDGIRLSKPGAVGDMAECRYLRPLDEKTGNAILIEI